MPRRSIATARWLLIFPIKIYKAVISPLFPDCCRFYPSCSTYAIQAIERHGPFKGSWLAVKRIFRCHPGSEGGFDPVPALKHQPSVPAEVQDNHGY